ncbi:MAG: 4-hydroxy-tetrahydrodipicolinate synthase [Gammaproteobacteria bacterium]|nr:4-hydroxy-tetrahydrodipicolinate synthase [Gammaproteobacteria bacterium]
MFQGSMVALVTPMHENGDVDHASLEKLIDFHIENGTSAIVSMGTTGESATLDTKQHCAVIRYTVEYVNKRLPVIAGTGANSTTEAIELTRCAQDAGADACLLVTPYYNKPTQHGLIRHHQVIADAVAIPQILYNVPGRTAVDMLPETIAALADVPNIIGVKEATGDLSRLATILQLCGDKLDVYSGDDATGTDFLLQGGKGVISVTNNVAPKAMAEMCKAALAGDAKKAHEINSTLSLLHERLFIESSPIPVKWALAEMGMIELGIRLPLTVLSEQYHEPVREALRQAGLL